MHYISLQVPPGPTPILLVMASLSVSMHTAEILIKGLFSPVFTAAINMLLALEAVKIFYQMCILGVLHTITGGGTL